MLKQYLGTFNLNSEVKTNMIFFSPMGMVKLHYQCSKACE